MKKNSKSTIKSLLMSICLAGLGAFMFASGAYADGVFLTKETSIGDGTYHKSRGYNSNATIDDINLWYADNNTTEWQELGYSGGFNDYGVYWSTDGGNTWGHEDLYVGQEVTFRFNMHSDNVGNHYANLLKAWIDWGADDTIVDGKTYTTYEFGESEKVVSEFEEIRTKNPYKDSDAPASNYTFDSGYDDNDPRDYYYDTSINKYVGGYGNDNKEYEITVMLGNEHLGTAYLRARVTCSHSIVQEQWSGNGYDNWNEQWYSWLHTQADYLAAFDAYSDYGQGEIEDWKFTVFGDPGNPGSPVPEPTTLALFGMGLIGLARVGRKKA